MEDILQWGLDVIIFIQQIRTPLLDAFWGAVTDLGSGSLHLIFILPLLMWCVDYSLGVRIIVLCIVSGFSNFFLKEFFSQPRPYELDPSVAIAFAKGHGLPSGHAQASLVFWGALACESGKGWFRMLAGAVIMLVGFSRIYLGVHFPTDVLAGWVLGLAFLGLYMGMAVKIERLLKFQNPAVQIVFVAVVSLGLLLINTGPVTVRITGMLCGVGMGAAVKGYYLAFEGRGPWRVCGLRYFAGMAGLFTISAVFRKISSHDQTMLALGISFIHFLFLGLWMALGAPWMFRLLKIDGSGKGSEL